MAQEPEKNSAPVEATHPDSGSTSKEVTTTSHAPTVDDSYGYHDDPYAYQNNSVPAVQEQAGSPPPPPPKPPEPAEEEDPDEQGMLRMSFLEHLEELRSRLIKAITGLGVAFILSLTFSSQLWKFVSAPAKDALMQLGINPPKLVQTTPMESFSIIWMKLPLLTAIFIGSPWVLYQIWAFIAPGLYKNERRWAVPFVAASAGLFITGGMFAYFVAFRFGLVFLLGLGRDFDLQILVSISEYFDLFINVILGISLVFELPVLIFFLTLLHVLSPRWLLENSRYAILAIVMLAALITPTPDIFNLMIFAVPMVLLYFIGVFASYLLVLKREKQKFPWKLLWWILAGITVVGSGIIYIAISTHGYKLVPSYPFLVR